MGNAAGTIIIIDDNLDYLFTMKTFLSRNGFNVETASDGTTGIDLIKKLKPGLIMLDVMMETTYSGFEVCRQVRNDAELKKIPIIGISGMEDELGLKFDKYENDHMTLTYHDSCNVARATRMGDKPGGQFTIPREIIKATCNNFYDMPADTIHEATFCCGGGGGLLTDDLMELRVKGAVPRMDALKRVIEEDGVTHMAAICAICKSQFTKVLPYYGMGMDMIVSVHQLVSNAIVLGAKQ